jgi:hypothetical protein
VSHDPDPLPYTLTIRIEGPLDDETIERLKTAAATMPGVKKILVGEAGSPVALLEDLVERLQEQLGARLMLATHALDELDGDLESGEAHTAEAAAAIGHLEVLLEEPRCRLCGCTHHSPCETEDGPCAWAEANLCTACAAIAALLEDEVGELGGGVADAPAAAGDGHEVG